MNRNNNTDWTDVLRESLETAEATPSKGGWGRLKDELHPSKAIWWPYALAGVACALVCGAFLFPKAASAPEVTELQPAQQTVLAEASIPEEAPTIVEAPSIEEAPTVKEFTSPKVNPSPAPAETSAPEEISAPIEKVPAATESFAPAEEQHPIVAEEPAPAQDRSFREILSPGAEFMQTTPKERKKKRPVSVSVSMGGAFGSASSHNYLAQQYVPGYAGTKASGSSYNGEVVDISEIIDHQTPFNANVDLMVPLSERIDISTGVEYARMNSTLGYGSQNVEWVGIPVRVGYRLGNWGPYSIGLSTGVKAEKCLQASLLGMSYNEPMQFAANVGANCRLALFGPVSLSFYPELSYFFTKTSLPTYRSDIPLSFNICAGLSIDL